MTLRPHQQVAHDAVMAHIRVSREPCLVEAPTAFGKSHLIAALAESIHAMSNGKHILCLAPSAELVEQNAEKYKATGAKASLFSASAGEKSLRHPVVFGTPGTVINRISRFDNKFAAVIVDEAHGMTPTVISIIAAMKEANQNLRVIGTTATPYRMMTGYIFGMWPDGSPVAESQTKEPYFAKMVYTIPARELIADGYLTPPIIGEIGSDHYETAGMELNSRGQFDAADVDRAFTGHGRKTAGIIEDIVRQARDRRGVMIFAATVKHAHECMASLPESLSAIVTSETTKVDRKTILKAFKARKLKYLVNVSVLTTGFDATHVDVIAFLRATESVGLLQQIVGRGLRIEKGKTDCLVLDYAENIERHCPDGDIFAPEIKVRRGDKEEGELRCVCPECHKENVFSPRPNDDGYEISADGYFLDLDGNYIQTEWGSMPAHYGRRCGAMELVAGDFVRCSYRWTSKECPHCMEPNDIAARYCSSCKGEIVDPNEKLRLNFKQYKKDPTKVQTDVVTAWSVLPSVSRSGKPMDTVKVSTEYRSFTVWVMREPAFPRARKEREMLDALGGDMPKTITYQKEDTGFYRVFRYNGEPDALPDGNTSIRKPELPRGVPGRGAGAGDLFQSPAA